MKNLLLSQDLRNIPEDYIHDHPDCGRLRIHSIGLDKIDVLRKFYNKCFRPGYILGDKELFQWFFKHNGGHVVVISKDDEIIAHQGYVPIVFTNGNQDYRGFISASTMVSEDYRRKGLMTYLRSGIQENYDGVGECGEQRRKGEQLRQEMAAFYVEVRGFGNWRETL